ncbi:dTMP kinase [Microbaculum marinum]|uniref:Thymidylate kinase n=1 Tax=Microbaculum marinum TaxID=1764581 RepID=A0AAW9RHN8_9HYPH
MALGKFITFEGGEGTGKSTQLKRLSERLRKSGIDVVTTREPGGTPGAEIIRRTILSGRVARLGPFAEALLMNAARDDHLNEVIRPALVSGSWVLCDRFADSTRAYQGTLGGVDSALLKALEKSVVGDDMPDLTLILDLDPEIGLTRARAATAAEAGEGASDRFEKEDIEQHRKLRQAFLDIARDEPDRCVLIDANRTVDEVAASIWEVVTDRLDVAADETNDSTADR